MTAPGSEPGPGPGLGGCVRSCAAAARAAATACENAGHDTVEVGLGNFRGVNLRDVRDIKAIVAGVGTVLPGRDLGVEIAFLLAFGDGAHQFNNRLGG
jgi:hypothetical protein